MSEQNVSEMLSAMETAYAELLIAGAPAHQLTELWRKILELRAKHRSGPIKLA